MSDPESWDERHALSGFVTEARWFGGKGRDAVVHDVRRLGRLGKGTAPAVVIDLVEVRYRDDAGPDTELYQVPLALYAEPQERLEHALVGSWPEPALGMASAHAYDAVHDREAMAGWLRCFVEAEHGADDEAHAGDLIFHRLPGHDLDITTHSTLFSGEQSNSSVMFGEDALLKVFRKLTAGHNPDISVHEVLTRAGSEHVADLYGWLDVPSSGAGGAGTDTDPDQPLQLAMLQQFLRTATGGWEAALASVRDLFAEADLHAEEAGADFASESARLGVALAEVHAALAESFPTRPRSPGQMAELAATMAARLDEALRIVPALAEHEQALRHAYDDVAHHPGDVAQQVHGDLHLGQTLRTVRGWKIVDFEGEPAKSLAERLLPDSPFRDVAGMLRSFDYAPRVVASTLAAGDPADTDAARQLSVRATEWSTRNQAAFLSTYCPDGLTDADRALLTAYVADKAVYEAVYETRNRPTWVSIPLDAIARELSTGGAW